MGDVNSISTRYTPPPPDLSLPPINVLTEVHVDDKGISLIGRYDPHFPTGPIPYAALLATALNYPHPGFDLAPYIPPQTEEAISREMERINRLDDLGTLKYFGDIVLAHPDLQEQVVAALPHEIDVSTRRALMLAGATCFASGKADCSGVPTENLDLLLLPVVLEQAGSRQASTAMRAALADSDQIPWNEVPSEFSSKLKGLSAEQRERFILIEMAKGLGLPDPTNAVDRAMASTEERRAFAERMKRRTEELFVPAFTEITRGAFSHLVLSSKDTEARYGDLGYATPRFIDMPSDSQLARILFEADYRTKFLDQLDTRSTVPSHKDGEEFPFSGGGQSHTEMTLVPDTVQVAYKGARAQFIGATLALSCSSTANEGTTNAYCDQVTNNFDAYAHAFPSLHAAREAMKVVALAPWLKQQGVTAGEEDHSWTPPARVAPEAGMHFYLPTSRITTSIEGGVDFTRVEPMVSGAAAVFSDTDLLERSLPQGTYAPFPQDPTMMVVRLDLQINPKDLSSPQHLMTGVMPPSWPMRDPSEDSSPSLRADPGFGKLNFGSPTEILVPEPEDVDDTMGPIEPGDPQRRVTVDKWAAMGRFVANKGIADGVNIIPGTPKVGTPGAALVIGLVNALRENTESFAWQLYYVTDDAGIVKGLQIQTNWFDSWLRQQRRQKRLQPEGILEIDLMIPAGSSLPGGAWNSATLRVAPGNQYRPSYLGIDP